MIIKNRTEVGSTIETVFKMANSLIDQVFRSQLDAFVAFRREFRICTISICLFLLFVFFGQLYFWWRLRHLEIHVMENGSFI